MPKSKSVYICQECGQTYPKWVGQCYQCGQWNSLVEETTTKKNTEVNLDDFTKNLVQFSQAEAVKGDKKRVSTTIREFDRVLSGENSTMGMVEGAVMLIGGEPGIGKSTILTQVVIGLLSDSFVRKKPDAKSRVLYVSGEENPDQISLRINRILNIEQKNTFKEMSAFFENNLSFVTSIQVEVVCEAIKKIKPMVVIVDSIQTLKSISLTGASGSIGQIRESAEQLTEIAKSTKTPMFLVGHVTKEGQIAGPKVLEHIVDTVIELNGERTSNLRFMRTVKNRFGPTDEVGVFKMTQAGFESVDNPSELFLADREADVPGSSTVCIIEGTRPLLVEVQALVTPSRLAMPRRVGRGVELSRIQILAAVLEKHCKLPLSERDIFLSAAGGFTIKEPAVDLGLAVAIASSLKNKKIPQNMLFIGEIGLLGEIRPVVGFEKREKEAKKLGFERVISKKSHKRVEEVLRDLGL